MPPGLTADMGWRGNGVKGVVGESALCGKGVRGMRGECGTARAPENTVWWDGKTSAREVGC